MFTFEKIDFKKIGLAMIGTIVLTFTMVGAAVGPARAIETGNFGIDQELRA